MIVSFIAGMIFFAVMYRLYGRVDPEVRTVIEDKITKAVCDHNYQYHDSWSSDGLGIAYGYRYYKCTKCGKIDKRFWHA